MDGERKTSMDQYNRLIKGFSRYLMVPLFEHATESHDIFVHSRLFQGKDSILELFKHIWQGSQAYI